MRIGEVIKFGNYEWRVLEVQGDRALLITEYLIEQRPYHNKYIDITWEHSEIRRYLNTAFLDGFSAEEQSRIIPVINKNKDNHWYGTDGGNDTEDRVFLLSLEEVVCQYFGDSSDKLFNPKKNQRYWFERKDGNNRKRIAYLSWNHEQIWWWTRSPGRVGVKAVYVHGDGNIGIQGNNVLKGNLADGKCKAGVRPAMWISIA